MKRKIITTSDGSKTIQIEDWDEQYHSKHGAIQEAYHVFIKHGLSLFNKQPLSILEIGFGTGLNALITWKESVNFNLDIEYTGVEKYPVILEELEGLNYISELNATTFKDGFNEMHQAPWDSTNVISDQFTLIKQKKDFLEIDEEERYNLIYFDAFGARVQPELWTEVIFLKMYNALKENGILVTYSAKGSVRRAMQTVGFTVERLPGPPGKREMLRARKVLDNKKL
ncbi:MAG: SAM-dependent methyltransferase [Flavobacteriaceae bacterium]|nr:MAG: SAM-dependent methyltransferase [Flavobacteriaceae bacterium]